MTKSIQIFKPGKHTAMSGVTLEFTESILKASAEAYDPSVFRAPLVVGHPQTDSAAYGWVDKLEYADAIVNASTADVNAEFAELVNKKTYPKVSASWYTPDSPSNPVPGVYYLKHVGFLGGAAPAIKGLADASFAANEDGVVEFTDWDQMTIAGIFRRLREYIIGKDGVEAADKTLPSYEIESLQINAALEEDEPTTTQFSETNNLGDEMSAEDKARLAMLETENATLKTENASFAEREKTQTLAITKAANVSFAEGLIQSGKLLPANKEATIALLDSLSAATTAVEFGEGDAKATKTPLDIYKSQLESSPVLVNFGESAANKELDSNTVNFAAPAGFSVDAENLELHQKVMQYAETNKVSYDEALTKVSK